MNGYFGIKSNEKGTFLIMKPPVEGGETVQLNEVNDYLNSHGIVLDSRAVSSAVRKSAQEKVVLKIFEQEIPPLDECLNIRISEDKMHAYARFIPRTLGGKKLTVQDIFSAIKERGIICGINETLVKQLVLQKKYCTDYEIATGKLPTVGRDATIKYHFDTDNSVRPTLREDGSVDFFHLNLIHHCNRKEVLAEIIPKEKGKDGFDVYGACRPAREVSDVSFRYGMNISVSEDGKRLLSDVQGHVLLIDGIVFAADVYEIASVGTASGDVEYNGNIQINGNVEDNYTVKASGTVEIRGTVGAANIEAGGDIIIAGGMYGQGKGNLRAGGNVVVKFLENVIVNAGGYVEAESILYSQITAGTDVNVEARKGYITGGRICAMQAVRAKNIGSMMGSDTTIEVGVDGNVKARFLTLQKCIMERKKARKQDQSVLENLLKKQAAGKLNSIQEDYLEKLQKTLEEHQEIMGRQREEMNRLAKELEGSETARIEVIGLLYSGTRVVISGVSMVIKDTVKHCRLVRSSAEIKTFSL